jgi:hypothetical protein
VCFFAEFFFWQIAPSRSQLIGTRCREVLHFDGASSNLYTALKEVSIMKFKGLHNPYFYIALSYFFVSLFFAFQEGPIFKWASFFFLISFGINAFKAIKHGQNQ